MENVLREANKWFDSLDVEKQKSILEKCFLLAGFMSNRNLWRMVRASNRISIYLKENKI